MKKCIKCNKEKNINDFHKRSKKDNSYEGRCIECSSLYHKQQYQENITIEREKRRKRNHVFRIEHPKSGINAHLKCRYGITLEEKEEMLKSQDNKCAICKKDISKRSCVDHNHETDKVRALLCDYCNTGIGMFRENTDLMKEAIRYLKKWTT